MWQTSEVGMLAEGLLPPDGQSTHDDTWLIPSVTVKTTAISSVPFSGTELLGPQSQE
jgi:hypothetical protein